METRTRESSGRKFPANYGGAFGYWCRGPGTLPAFRYTCNPGRDPFALYPTAGQPSRDHWHQVGNDRITATAHNGGHLDVLLADRGMQWMALRHLPAKTLGGGIAFLCDDATGRVTSDLNGPRKTSFTSEFGMGYFRKWLRAGDLLLDHAIFAPFGGDPVLVSIATLRNLSINPVFLHYTDYWGVLFKYMIPSWMYLDRERTKYGNSRVISSLCNILKVGAAAIGKASEQIRYNFADQFSWAFSWNTQDRVLSAHPNYSKKPPVSPADQADRDYYPPPIFLAPLGVGDYVPATHLDWTCPTPERIHYNLTFQAENRGIQGNCLACTTPIIIESGQQSQVAFLFGAAPEGTSISELVAKYRNLGGAGAWDSSNKAWKEQLPRTGHTFPYWLRRELAWDAYYMRSALMYDAYFQCHFFPQGSGYSFLHGANGAIRDYALFLQAAIYMWPSLAREHLSLMCKLMTPDGNLPYSHLGFGQVSGAAVHKTSSDLHLFFLWAVADYVFFTRDFAFLDESCPFYNAKAFLNFPAEGTVYDRLVLAVKYILQRIGTGVHGLIRVASGDWSDGISMMVRNRGRFLKDGESTFNSAFALYLIPKILPLFEDRSPEITRALRCFLESLKKAINKTWNGHWYYRGYDGLGNPIGDRNLFLEHHAWMLIANVIPPDRLKVLLHNIELLCETPAKAGQFICNPPQKTLLNILPYGWDVNGGVWAAINFLLAWGYSNSAPDRAWSSLCRNTLRQRSIAYPNQWYGIWSGPDAFNADYAVHAGETFNHVPTPMVNFPIMNLNFPAGTLGSYFKLAGLEPTFAGLTLAPKLPFRQFSLQTPAMALEWSPREFQGTFHHLGEAGRQYTLDLAPALIDQLEIRNLSDSLLTAPSSGNSAISFECPPGGFKFAATFGHAE